MNYLREHSRCGALLLSAALLVVPAGIFFPSFAWLAGALILVLASLLVMSVGIRLFLAICVVTVGHLLVLGPPPPYGRGDHPLDYVLVWMFLPLTLAAVSIGVWFWNERPGTVP